MMRELGKIRRNRQNGMALILAILTCVILTILAVGLAGVARVELLASRGSYDRLQARSLAIAGLNLARSVIMYQDEDTEENTMVDGATEDWFTLAAKPPLTLGEGSSRVIIIDACSRLNINIIDEATFTNIFEDPELAAAIVQWREEHGKFYSVGDLLQVEGMTAEKLAPVQQWLTAFSLERNISHRREQRLNLNDPNLSLEALQRQGLSSREAQRFLNYRNSQPERKITGLGQLFQVPLSADRIRQILNRVSVSGDEFADGRLNINTAPREVLEFLPGVSPSYVETLLQRRSQPGGTFRAPADALMLPGLSQEGYMTLTNIICVKTSSFIIESEGELNDRPAHCILQGLVLRQPGPIAPLQSGLRELSQEIFLTGTESYE